MPQRQSDPSSRFLQRSAASKASSYKDPRSDISRLRNGDKRSRNDLLEDQVESPRKLARLDGDRYREREGCQHPSNPIANTSNPKPEQEFVDGPGHIVFIDEGGKRCPAICFNELLLREFNDTAVISREILKRDEEIHKAQDEFEMIKSLNFSPDMEEAKRTVEEAAKNLKDIEAGMPELVETQRRCDSLAEKNKWSKILLNSSREISRYMIEQILDRENLLRIPKPKPQEQAEDKKDHSAEPTPIPEKAPHERQKSIVAKNSPAPSPTRPESPMPPEEQFSPRQLALRHLRWAREEMYNRREHFNFMQEYYAEEVAAERKYRREQYPDRPASTTQTDVDLGCLRQKRRATRELIEAEQDFDRAEQHAEGLGLGDILADPQACYWGEYNDDFRPRTPHTPSMFPVDQPRIEAWMDSVPDSAVADAQRQKDVELVAGDEWEAKSVEVFDSVSLVDYSMYRKKIDWWREISGRIRAGGARRPLPGTVRRNPRRRCRYRLSPGETPR